jgi:altronate dehydratase small subunit
MKINAILMSSKDDVVTALTGISVNEDIVFQLNGQEKSIRAISDIPKFHKAAIRQINRGEPVKKYGERIGYATTNINAGENVHRHNLASSL